MMRGKFLHILILCLASLNLFVLYITRSATLLPIPGHPFWEMAIAIAVLYAIVWKNLPDPYYKLLGAFCLVGVFLSFFFYHKVGSDGREYFMQLRSLVMDRDLDLSNDYKFFPGRGEAPYFPFGPALFWSPFYILAHFILSILRYPNLYTGVTPGHQSALSFAAVVYGSIALFLIFTILKKYFSPKIALVSVLVLTCASFGVWYWLYQYFMPHTVSLFITTLFLYLWLKWRNDPPGLKRWFVLGLVAGLMAMGRWQDCVFVLVPALDELPKFIKSMRTKDRPLLRRLSISYLLFVIGGVIAFSPQLIFWKVMFGSFTGFLVHYSLQWTGPNFTQVLYSYNRGLLTWTPIVTVCLIGLVCLLWRESRLASLMLLGFLAELYVNSANSQWWSGASFGARRFTACFLPFSLGLAESLRLLLRHPAVSVTVLCAFLVMFNVTLMHRVANGKLAMEGMASPEDVLSGTVEDMRRSTGVSPTFPFSTLFGIRYGVAPGRFDELLCVWRLGDWSVDLGEPDDKTLLGYGWAEPEKTPGGMSIRWSKGTASTLLVPLARATGYDLDLMAQPYRYPTAPAAQSLKIFVNGKQAASLQMSNSLQQYHVFVPGEYWRSGINEIRFDYGYTAIPQKISVSTDTRELAVFFDWIQASVRRH